MLFLYFSQRCPQIKWSRRATHERDRGNQEDCSPKPPRATYSRSAPTWVSTAGETIFLSIFLELIQLQKKLVRAWRDLIWFSSELGVFSTRKGLQTSTMSNKPQVEVMAILWLQTQKKRIIVRFKLSGWQIYLCALDAMPYQKHGHSGDHAGIPVTASVATPGKLWRVISVAKNDC